MARRQHHITTTVRIPKIYITVLNQLKPEKVVEKVVKEARNASK